MNELQNRKTRSLNQTVKRIVSLLLSFAMLFTITAGLDFSVYAANGVSNRLNSLKSTYPHGYYWNHYVNSYSECVDNLNQWDNNFSRNVTTHPCNGHGIHNTVGMWDCNAFQGGQQCWGFANRIFYDVFGQQATSLSRRSDRANVTVGDWIRLNNDTHSAVVLSKSGNNITVVECNNGNTCKILWGTTYSVNAISYFYHASNWNDINNKYNNETPLSFNSQTTTAIGNNVATINFKISNPNYNLVNKVGARIRKSGSSEWKYHEEVLSADVYKSNTLTTFYVVGSGKEFNYSLTAGTSYVWQPYAVTGGKTYYGSEITFKTSGTAPSPHTHTWNSGVITKMPTCSSTGTKTYTCTSCKQTKTETIAKLSHSYSWTSVNGLLVKKCNKCADTKVKLPFKDVSDYAGYGEYLAYTSSYNSFIAGTNPPQYTQFSPTTPITRAMFIAVLYRMAGSPYDNGKNPYKYSPFSDVYVSVYYYNAACWALDNDITNQTVFKPNDCVTREQTARFLFAYAQKKGKLGNSNYKKVKLSDYPDYNSVHSWAVEPLKWANYNDMITGTQQGYINPQGATQRIHATRILYGFGKACSIGEFS